MSLEVPQDAADILRGYDSAPNDSASLKAETQRSQQPASCPRSRITA